MESYQSAFLREVEEFLSRTGMTATAFGVASIKDPRLVFDLREGRATNTRTMDRIRTWMRVHPKGVGRNPNPHRSSAA